MNALETHTHEQHARARVDQGYGFQTHLLVYIVVILGLLFINLATPGGIWFYWPALGWGLILLAHAFVAYTLHALLDGDREERETPHPLVRG